MKEKCSYIRIVEYVEGLIKPAGRKTFEEHLKECSKCQREVENLKSFHKMMGQVHEATTLKAPEFMKDKAKELSTTKWRAKRKLTKIIGRIVDTDLIPLLETPYRDALQLQFKESTHTLYDMGQSYVSVKITKCMMDNTLNIMGQIYPTSEETVLEEFSIELYSDEKLTGRVNPDLLGRFRFQELRPDKYNLRLVSDEIEGFIDLNNTEGN